MKYKMQEYCKMPDSTEVIERLEQMAKWCLASDEKSEKHNRIVGR